MTTYLNEENLVPVVGKYDVIVIGGGVAGVGAALAAKRNGCSTLLIEKSIMLGGLATLGLIAVYLPLCDGKGRKMVGGIAEELLHVAIKYGYDNLPAGWTMGCSRSDAKGRYMTVFSPAEFVIALDELLCAEGVDLLFDTVFSLPVMEDGVCRGVIMENKTGRVAYQGKVIVDTTGDADVMYRAGAECIEADNWLSFWCYNTSLERMQKAVQEGKVFSGLHLQWFGADAFGKNAVGSARKYYGTDANEITAFVLAGRNLVRQGLDKAKADSRAYITLPGMAQFRTTRRIKGFYELQEDDINKHFADSIGTTGDWRKAGPVMEIPYRTLIVPGIHNIITAGRTIASAGDAWEITRVIPPAAMTGQAAGTAAALAAKRGCSVSEVDVAELQQLLEQSGVILHF
ncbi:MAG: FAD-dependent oxidoreductase [Firmicutes bacterium]|nr:FAD-dependent oxidoreductase [Bacillota bacterium]